VLVREPRPDLRCARIAAITLSDMSVVSSRSRFSMGYPVSVVYAKPEDPSE